ncbi:T9SS type B sorting domain-containing protein [Winogradskyella endarachnes]|uniref:T9SS type B sorting domain-containing protein n=1 Tax=Winogradskyella endarachnes TaxID=2681965 RepID=A0A6L6U759_9FLAO|nr:T9SS type B sorting domain-containing protein [Winogradskyella endarachnes]MUU78120.1 T9SS type B sorting domain-containing protein [Winogradskyella endarachnes]
MKKKILVFILIITSLQLFTQNEASFWYFGQNAGLQFNAENGSVTAITGGQINTLEGCTSISDADGNLLFYSDGITVWSGTNVVGGVHQIMQNGTGLKGDPSSTSSGLIVPKPQDPNVYYIFTVDEPHHFNTSNPDFVGEIDGDGVNDGLTYSKVDMSENGGFGAVDATEKNVPLITYDINDQLESELKCSEKITAVKADDCTSFWVITHFTDKFYAFKITENGVLVDEAGNSIEPTISTTGPLVPTTGYRKNALGYIKASPDGSKLVVAHHGFEANIAGQDAPGGVYLFDFNSATGEVSNPLELYSPSEGDSPYGVEFSANNKKVYATVAEGAGGFGESSIIQWDLDGDNNHITNSRGTISTPNAGQYSAAAIQLGIDGKIYRAQFDFNDQSNSGTYLGVITNPEADYQDVIYNAQGVALPSSTKSRIGLPPFIQSLFNTEIDIINNGISTTELKLCTGDDYTLVATNITGADYTWSFNNTPLTETSSQLYIDTPGYYEVYIEPNNGDCPIEGSAVVGVFDIPVANPLTDIQVCDDSNNDGFQSFNFSDKDSEALLDQDTSIYQVHYFENEEDANSGENEIVFPYINLTNPQTIFVRVDNLENPNCYDINSFNLEVFNVPQISDLNTIEICDNLNNPNDGIGSFNFNDLESSIFGEQDITNTSITYHLSQDDADTKTSALPINYSNSSAFNETIFVRIENILNADCYSTLSFNLEVNPIPIANDISIIQCDEDGIPEGFTTFNLNNHLDDITNSATDYSVEFYVTQLDAENQENAVNANAFQNYYNPQIIYTRVADLNSDCINYSEISLEVSTTSSNNTNLELCDDDGTEDGFATFNLSNADAAILAGTTISLDLSYYETYEDALLENNPLSNNYTNTTPYNQTIFGRVENANACYGISEIALTVFTLPNIETIAETKYCLNTYPETIILTGGVLEDIPNNYYYLWSTGETTSEIEISEAGVYTVRVTNTNGCFKDRTVTVLPSNIATITNIEVIDASENNSISVFVTGEGDYEYALDNEFGTYQNSNTFSNVLPGLHTVYVRDKNECGITEDLVSVIGFPKFFTPNNDTVNDFWQVYGITEQFEANAIIYIFDRYGKLLKELDPLSAGWDGMYNGHNMPTSDYWFKVTLEDGRVYTNHFTLKR